MLHLRPPRHPHGHAPPQPHLLIASQGPKGWPDGIHRAQHQHHISDDVDGEYRPHRAGPAVKEQVTGRNQELGDEEDLRPRRDGFEGRQELAPEQDVYKAYEYYRNQHPDHASYEALSPFRPASLEGVEYVDPKQLFHGRVDRDPDEQCE